MLKIVSLIDILPFDLRRDSTLASGKRIIFIVTLKFVEFFQSFIRDNPTGRLDQETYFKTMKTLVPDASLNTTLK